MRLIDADALGVGRCSKDVLPAAYCAGWNGLIELIENAPTIDAVQVVRCRDCKFGDWDSEPNDAIVCMRTKDGFWRSGNDFCSFGEQKEGADNERILRRMR